MSIGEVLATARTTAGLSVEDVSRDTSIRGTLIRAIEHDDFSLCGGSVYARGHIRSIARVVGVDPVPLISEYDGQYGGVPVPTQPAPTFDPEVAERTERRKPNWAAAMAAALLIVIVLAGVDLAGHRSSPTKETGGSNVAVGGPSSTPTPRATTTSPVQATPTALPTNAVALADGVTMVVKITGDKSWISVTNAAGQVLFQDVLNAGQQQTFTDKKQLRIVLGNSGAVDLVVNGHDLGAPGAPGAVSHLTFGPGDPTGGAG